MFADKIEFKFPKKGDKKSDGETASGDEKPDAEPDDDKPVTYEPGELGSMALKAIRSGDGEAFEEAIKKICA
jgi:hypothetical protein